jgi:hypothetical protein
MDSRGGRRRRPGQVRADHTDEVDRTGSPDDDERAADPAATDFDATEESMRDGEPTGPIPDIVRKAIAMGLTGFFSTEQTIRKALGDTLPQDWLDFVSQQSERTRSDLTEAIASEVGRSLRTIDLTKVADQLLSGRTLEVTARIRLLPLDDDDKKAEGSDS